MSSERIKKLQPASFRGVPFEVEEAPIAVGRRVEVHEYPKRDKPYVEDMGRAARDIRVTGFVVGDDYIEQSKKLIEELEKKGDGTLVHPWLGSLKVTLKELARIGYGRQNGLGVATIEMVFVEAGELSYPGASNATGLQSRVAADKLGASSVTEFSRRFNTAGMPDFVTQAARGDLSRIFGLVGGNTIPGLDQLGYLNTANRGLSSMLGLLSSPMSLGNGILGFFGLSGVQQSAGSLMNNLRSLLRLAGSSKLAPPVQSSIITPSRVQETANTTELNALTRRAVLVQAVGISSMVPVTVYDDAIEVRNDLAAALDAETLTAGDDVYVQLVDARTAVWRDLTDRARGSARLTNIRPSQTEPAIVLAYDLYERADRDDELVQRNRIMHPGFVPPVPLKVVSS